MGRNLFVFSFSGGEKAVILQKEKWENASSAKGEQARCFLLYIDNVWN